ncbi:UDP-glycosyltransferase 92A1-like [Olea europaea var. sylvestris]|uniref:UDP-glycosyltransferase 92A1-like n=1 Tax=Olea europaea var. sylvestris TaxID=158386 RepID=UPI000C1D730E|nr:UDP-glycosyltransferase 92A1-like [Olea europaea var. sylvestris]
MGSSQEHIVLLPFMAQGHLIPFLGLAKQIQQRFGFTITIASTPLNVTYLKSTIAKASTVTSQIHLAELPFNSTDHGLPPNTENTEALPLTQIVNLFHSSTALEAPFRSLVNEITVKDGQPPLCIISDFFMGWATDVAKSCGTVNVSFTTGGAYGTAAYMSLWQHLPHRSTGEDEFCLPGFPNSSRFHVSQLHQYLRDADGTDPWSRFFQPQISLSLGSFGWLCNTVEEIEPLGLDVLKKNKRLPIWCIGPLIPPRMLSTESSSASGSRIIGRHAGVEPGVSPDRCLEWLDMHSEQSVLYISFGSQNTIGPSQMMALATGLEDSKKPFIWAIRPPVGNNIRGEFKPEWLPQGFEEEMAKTKQGLLVHKWAPQLEILCHKSIGAFISHCGWNSIMESLSQGVPIIGWPLAAEQGYNSKMLMEEMGVSIELTRGLQSIITKDDVKRVINIVMDRGGKGKEMKKKAAEIGELIRASVKEDGSFKGSSIKAMDDFVSALLSTKGKGLIIPNGI